MPLSMTAFARCEAKTQWGDIAWELRSVNHRYLEPVLRLPEEFRHLEPGIRDLLGQRLGRGKVDLNLHFQPASLETTEFELNEELVARILHAAERISKTGENIVPLSANDVLRWPGVLQVPAVDLKALGESAMGLLQQALDELVSTRRREGERLQQAIEQRLEQMAGIVADVKRILPERLQHVRDRLNAKLAEAKAALDSERIEQEIVLFAQKLDVDEEIDRLETHLAEVSRVLKETGPIGRRMDFLMQELNREANTLSAKANDARLTRAAVDLKVLIEQMREQVQNIE